jgi:hypothetical protein
MIVRGSYDWKPADRKLSVQRHINWLDDKADIVWMDYDEWRKDPIIVSENAENVPKEIKAFIPKWRERAASVLNGPISYFCPIKWACSDVYYKGEKYRVDTGVIGGVTDHRTIDWLFEYIERDIAADLYSIGALYVEYRGMVD